MKKFRFILRRANIFLCDLAVSYALFYLLLFIRPVGFPTLLYYFITVALYFALTYGIFRAAFRQKTVGIAAIKKRPQNKTRILLFLLAILSLIFFQFFRQSKHFSISEIIHNKSMAFPVSIPEKKHYIKNIEQYKQSAVDYVMQLFDKYDIVILSERWHPEYTQWEFFSEIILNDAFAKKVKNVFTELGEVQNQEILDTYMRTHFSTEEDLQQATAQIVRENGGCWPLWSNKNIYDFILNLHQFNEARDSLNPIRLFFSDEQPDWESIQNPAQWDSIVKHTNRDSIMAYHILNRHQEQHLNKSLVIVNTRHAWNYGKNEAAYIFEKFPGKTAAVLINGTTQFFTPQMNGSLDEAALAITDSIWAIDFKECPLGNTSFDLMPSFGKNKFTYKDLFAGMVYCKHPGGWKRIENYPFMLDNYEDILLKRSALVGEDYLKMMTNSIKQGYFNKIEIQNVNPFLMLINVSFLAVHSIILLFVGLNLLIKLLVLLFKKQN